jgi:hypothetical protein
MVFRDRFVRLVLILEPSGAHSSLPCCPQSLIDQGIGQADSILTHFLNPWSQLVDKTLSFGT